MRILLINPPHTAIGRKYIEVAMHIRPRALARFFGHRDRSIRDAIHWYYEIGWRVIPFEIGNFMNRRKHVKNAPTLEEFWGEPQDAGENSMVVPRRVRRLIPSANIPLTIADRRLGRRGGSPAIPLGGELATGHRRARHGRAPTLVAKLPGGSGGDGARPMRPG